MKRYDYLVVGAGLFGCVFAHEMYKAGKSVLVIDKNDYVGGMCYTAKYGDIDVHMNGAHIFHTDDKEVWDYINQFSEFNNYRHKVIAKYLNKIYSLPFNMHTFYEIYGVSSIEEAKEKLEQDKIYCDGLPKNLEEQALNLVGSKIFKRLIEGYTEKQWGRKCKELSPDILKRLPLRFTYDTDYFNDMYQGIPVDGYTSICEKLLSGITYKLHTQYTDNLYNMADKIVYTGPIDELMKFKYGHLAYRGLKFKHKILEVEYYQGAPVINYTCRVPEYTRVIEHKLFTNTKCPYTVITFEYPISDITSRYYPINDKENNMLYNIYVNNLDSKFIVAGRLGSYRYYDMDDTIREALNLSKKEKEVC